MSRAFAPKVRPTTYRGSPVYEVDCREWKTEMATLGHPLRRRFPSESEAESWCRQLVVDHTVGRKMDPGPVALRSLCDLFQQSVEATNAPLTAKTYRVQSRRFLGFLAAHRIVDVREVTAAVIEMYRAELHAQGLQPNSIIGLLSYVGKLYRWANRTGYVEGNPAANIKLPRRESKRRNFTDEELKQLVDGATPELAPLWTMLLFTGMRRREFADLRCDQVVLETPAPFVIVEGKGGKVRSIPLVDQAQRAARYFLQRATGEQLVPYSYRRIYRLWIAERNRLELPADLDVHSFRHTFISWLANRTGTPLTEVMAVAGHASVVTTQVYVHRDEAQLRVGMQRMEADLVSAWYSPDDADQEVQSNQ